MEKVRFEAFNVEELRVLRRACYEAGAAFGDPGHTAAERATLDDLAVEILGELKKKEAETMTEKSAFDKALGELHDLIEWEDAEAAIRELHARQPEMERLYLDGKILPGELQALVMVSNCLEREFIHRQLATGRPLHLNI